MTQSPDSNQQDLEKRLLREIDEALEEMELSETAFQWAQNHPDAVDYAIRRQEAAVKHYCFLIRQAKKLELKVTQDELMQKVIKQIY